ncbi:hypothetical protein PG999_010185 [Apiospora kogelbergensis]|uniref:Uncharacterized protein n=2 Tax=Apiospora kogelbergensis TaxID=1337665 RepID=A0AAW0QBU3_9PEZI
MAAYPNGLERSQFHVRILRYDLGPLACVVYGEGDATIAPYGDFAAATPDSADIIPAPDNGSATVVVRGRLTPQKHAVELKMWNSNPRERLRAKQQMWLNRSKYLVSGYRARGATGSAAIGDPWEDVQDYMAQDDAQSALDKLLLLIPDLRAAVRASRNKQVTLVFREGPCDTVEVYKNNEQDSLVSQAMINKLWDTPRHKT